MNFIIPIPRQKGITGIKFFAKLYVYMYHTFDWLSILHELNESSIFHSLNGSSIFDAKLRDFE